MIRLRSILSLLSLLLYSAASTHADGLTPERVFSSPDLNGPRARNVQLSPDGRLATYLKPKPDDAQILDLWAYDVERRKTFKLIDAQALSGESKEMSDALRARRERLRLLDRGVVEYRWDDQGRYVLAPLDGDLYLVARDDGRVRRLTHSAGDEIDARVSPRGAYVSYVRDQNLYALHMSSGEETALSEDGAGPVSWGVAEFVAQEEMRRHTGYWWSPDERRVALTRVDESGVEMVPRVEFGVRDVKLIEQRYPRPGGANAIVELYIYDIEQRRRTKVDLGEDRDIYVARVDWSVDGKTLYVQRQSRDQKRLDLLAADVATGRTRLVLSETSPHWVELSDDFRSLPDGAFIWSSERGGFRHLYLYRADGSLIRQLTSGSWPVSALEGVDLERKRVLFTASKDSVLERHLYAVSYAAPTEPTKLTSGEGWWTVSVAQRGGVFAGTYSDPATPPRTAIYGRDGTRLVWIEPNTLDAEHPLSKYARGLSTPEFGVLSSDDGVDLHYALWKPPGFDPSRRYPVVVSVYGGPVVQTVRKRWGALSDQLLLEAGYILFRLDNRGSANRSSEFKTSIHRRLGMLEVADQLAGARFLATLPYVDPQRLAVMGWSYGGYLTLMLMTAPQSPFKAGIAGAAPTDWRLYDAHYAERFMETPGANAEGYAAADVASRLKNLRGSLLLVHGMTDDNVTMDHATRIAAGLQAQSTPFELMLYPAEAHLLSGHAKQLHLWRTYLDFLDRNLRPHP